MKGQYFRVLVENDYERYEDNGGPHVDQIVELPQIVLDYLNAALDLDAILRYEETRQHSVEDSQESESFFDSISLLGFRFNFISKLLNTYIIYANKQMVN